MKKFWMVLGYGTPSVRHATEEKARNEAERLARQFPGQEFTVLEAIAQVRLSDVLWIQLKDQCAEMPF